MYRMEGLQLLRVNLNGDYSVSMLRGYMVVIDIGFLGKDRGTYSTKLDN